MARTNVIICDWCDSRVAEVPAFIAERYDQEHEEEPPFGTSELCARCFARVTKLGDRIRAAADTRNQRLAKKGER